MLLLNLVYSIIFKGSPSNIMHQPIANYTTGVKTYTKALIFYKLQYVSVSAVYVTFHNVMFYTTKFNVM